MAVRIIKRQMTPAEVARTKPRILNPDGTYSSERSITIGVEGQYINVPTIWEGKQLRPPEAIERAIKSRIKYPKFRTLREALQAAKERTEALGREGMKLGR